MASFPGLPRDLPAYLADLAANNSRDWFEAHRERYKPFGSARVSTSSQPSLPWQQRWSRP